jgi:hypothetical protein
LTWNAYAFLADNREAIRYRKTLDFESCSILSILLRFSRNCLCAVGFKRNNSDPERCRRQCGPIDWRSSWDENATGNGWSPESHF